MTSQNSAVKSWSSKNILRNLFGQCEDAWLVLKRTVLLLQVCGMKMRRGFEFCFMQAWQIWNNLPSSTFIRARQQRKVPYITTFFLLSHDYVDGKSTTFWQLDSTHFVCFSALNFEFSFALWSTILSVLHHLSRCEPKGYKSINVILLDQSERTLLQMRLNGISCVLMTCRRSSALFPFIWINTKISSNVSFLPSIRGGPQYSGTDLVTPRTKARLHVSPFCLWYMEKTGIIKKIFWILYKETVATTNFMSFFTTWR